MPVIFRFPITALLGNSLQNEASNRNTQRVPKLQAINCENVNEMSFHFLIYFTML